MASVHALQAKTALNIKSLIKSLFVKLMGLALNIEKWIPKWTRSKTIGLGPFEIDKRRRWHLQRERSDTYSSDWSEEKCSGRRVAKGEAVVSFRPVSIAAPADYYTPFYLSLHKNWHLLWSIKYRNLHGHISVIEKRKSWDLTYFIFVKNLSFQNCDSVFPIAAAAGNAGARFYYFSSLNFAW